MKKIIHVILGLMLVGTFLSAIAKEMQSNRSLFCEDINSSMVSFHAKEFQSITAVTKIWHETFDAHRKFVSHFLTSSNLTYGNFMQDIPIFDKEGKNIEVSDWDSADCSIVKYMLVKNQKDKSIYLLTTHRQDKFPKPQYEPSKQLVTGYILTIGSEKDGTPLFFRQKFSFVSKKQVCSGQEIQSLFNDAISNLNQGK